MSWTRKGRQAVIAFVFVVIAGLLFWGVYVTYIKAPETCVDTVKNQDETGIDCGGVCGACKEVITGQDFQIKESVFVQGGNGVYDVMARIYNPNDIAGASAFEYTFELKDASGTTIATRTGKSFILPQETKAVIEVNLETAERPASLALKVENVEWEKFSGYQAKPSINIYQKRYGEISSGIGFSAAEGLLSNESPYDFRSVIVKVILRDVTGRALAFNSTEMRTIVSREQRQFKLIWPMAFPGTVEKIDMEVDADVYHSENFLKQYMPGGKFQDLTPPAAY